MNVLFSAGQCFLSKLYNCSTCSPVQGRQGNACDNQQHNNHCSRNGAMLKGNMFNYIHLIDTTVSLALSVPVEMSSCNSIIITELS